MSNMIKIINTAACFNTLLFYFIIIIIFWGAALGLHCCTQAFSSCGERGLLFFVVHGLLIAGASLVAEHGLWARELQ